MPDLFQIADTHNAGGKVRLRLQPGVIGSAIFGGPRDCYRYSLERRNILNKSNAPTFMFLWMNPSEAGPEWDDPTVAKGWRFTKAWGGGAMLVGNVHAYRCTDQQRLAEVVDPFGPDNLSNLLDMASRADSVIVGYGTPRIKALRERGPAVAQALINAGVKLHILRLSRNGVPCHPLYLPETLVPVAWSGPHA